MKAQHFKNIWKKAGKMKCRLRAKVKQRGLEPTYENCRAYYLGIIRPYTDMRGNVKHLHKRHDRRLIWRIKNNGRTQSVQTQNKPKKRRFKR